MPILRACLVRCLFLSTPSARRATLPLFRASENSDFYPRPPRGGRPCASGRFPSFFPISIHALREEGDLSPLRRSRKCFLFLSTPSARRATGVGGWADLKQEISIHALREEGDLAEPPFSGVPGYFYPRPPRGGRRWRSMSSTTHSSISIHALREEGDRSESASRSSPANFYPRPPRGGRRTLTARRRRRP